VPALAKNFDRLTDAQSVFAREHGASPVMCSDQDRRLIFMYRNGDRRTFRWLVDEAGRVVESAAFRRSGTPR
jgi:hypothetical protein